jgi:hypothetical protein
LSLKIVVDIFGNVLNIVYLWDKFNDMTKAVLFTGDDPKLKNRIQFLLGKEVTLSAGEINSIAHLTNGNEWVIMVLERMGLTISDLLYEEDRKVLEKEFPSKK